VDLEEMGLRVFDFSPPPATQMKRYVTRREAPLTEGTKQPADPPDSDIHTAVTPELELPDIARGRRNFIVSKDEKVLEEGRAKWVIGELNIFVNLIHKSLQSILHHNK
jgi:hypothetical protein